MLHRLKTWAQVKSLKTLFYCNGHCRALIDYETFRSDPSDLLSPILDQRVDNPAQADLLIVSGAINELQINAIKDLYSKMHHPKWILGLGDCFSSKAVFSDAYAMKSLLELPIDVLIKGCPPTRKDLEEGLSLLYTKILERQKEKGRGP